MARSCGIRIGPRRFELVVLDGSAKKHKISAYMSGELPRTGEDPVATAAAVLREAVKQHNVPRDNVAVAIDTGLAAFRTIKVPFTDDAKIEEVLKFEIEGQLPQWNIDDVVVDFHKLETTEEASELLVTAVPKADLRTVLSICEKAGVEALEAELETSAMVNAATTANLCPIDSAQILVHIGETSTSVVVMDGGKVREMRAIHIGALSHEFAAPAEGEAPVEGEAPAEGVGVLDAVKDPGEVQRRLDQAIKRIRRELGRTVSAARTVHPISAVYVCGLDLPGLAGSRILDAEVKVLDVFEKDGGQPAEGFSPLVVPYGVAVRQLGGGVLKPSLRREELHYSGAFERVELPVAFASLLALVLVVVWAFFLYIERQETNNKLGYWRDSARNFLLGDPAKGKQGYLHYPSDRVKKYVTEYDKDTSRNRFEQLRYTNGMITDDIKKIEKELGQDTEIKQPQSAFVGLTLVLDALSKHKTDQIRPSLRTVNASYQAGKTNKPEHVRVDLSLSILADNSVAASEAFDEFQRAIRTQPWLIDVTSKSSDPVEGGKGIFLSNVTIEVDVSKAPTVTEGT